jgi:hypothetical protein
MVASPCRGALCLALCLLVLPRQHRSPAAAAQTTNLTAGAALAPPGYITSPSGVFAFGFRALDSDPTQFILATWFRFADGAANGSSSSSPAPPPQSVVWFAKKADTGATPLATARSALSVTPAGQLALEDGTNGSNTVLWSPPVNSTAKRASVLALLDSGDLRLLADGGGVLWRSFEHPRDTLLPGQSVAWDAGATGKLVSKRADAEFTTGRFSLGVQEDGNVVLYVDLLVGNDPANAYWQAYTNGGGGGTIVSFDEPGRLYYTLRNRTVQNLVPPMPNSTVGEYYQFARMDPDGIVRVYVRPKNAAGGNATWAVSGAFPSNGCNRRTSGLQGLCGPGSYCVETKDRLTCECPSGYTHVDPQHRDTGCAPEFAPQSCGGDDDDPAVFTLVEVPNTTWETSLYYKKLVPATEEQCRDYCLNDCFCTAALITGGTKCVEMAALTNGRQASDAATKALIKVRTDKPDTASSWPGTRAVLHYRIITGCLAFLSLAAIAGLLAQHHLNKKNTERQRLLGMRAFSWKELYRATNGFEKHLGRGSFGEVYLGELRSPTATKHIAVKRLVASNEYSEREFANEVQSLGQIHHRNLVGMVGYCKEGRHRMLVLEFMPGGSLRGALFNPGAARRPPWRWRAEAALGVARGIEYLHDGCASPIIHCDIKPDNILLDGEGAPRITDFGISKLLGGERVHATVTNVRGTRGYIAPEWLRGEARVDTKADVYSFGVVLLEMICCRRCQEPVPDARGVGDETVTLFGWAGQLVGAGRTELMLSSGGDDDAVEDLGRVERYSRVAFWCMEPNPALRPTMHQVVQMLEGAVEAEVLPDPPGCYLESSPLISIADKKE